MSTTVLLGVGIGGSLGALLLGILIWWTYKRGYKIAQGEEARRNAEAWQEFSKKQGISSEKERQREDVHVKTVADIIRNKQSADDVGRMLSAPITSKAK